MTGWKRALLMAGGLLAAVAVAWGAGPWAFWYRNSHHRFQAEIISCKTDRFALAAGLGDRAMDGVFYLYWPENTAPEAKKPGALVEVTGPSTYKISYPGTYDDALRVKRVGERPDPVASHYQRLLDSYLAGHPAPDGRSLYRFLHAREELNQAEAEGLHYLMAFELRI